MRTVPTRFFGRTSDLLLLREGFRRGDRLITLVGPAGIGKTTLALRFAELAAEEFAHVEGGGAWFCDLTEARAPSDIATAVGVALDIPLSGRNEDETLERLGDAIASRGRVLVILDNCEQVIDGAARAVSRWLERAPLACIVVTSREALRIQGERIHELQSLAAPEAIELFVDRASLAKADWSVHDANAISEIVHVLEGLPLAIELAAARIGLFGERGILEGLDDRLSLLESASRDRTARQRTLRGAIDWSWTLLSPLEQDVLRQCAVFRGGFDMQAAEHVIALEGISHVEAIEALRAKSLLHTYEPVPGRMRCAMYENIRAFVLEKPAPSNVEERHTDHYLALAERLGPLVVKRGGSAHLRDLVLELDNLGAVHERGLASGTPEGRRIALRAALATREMHMSRGLSRCVAMLGAAIDATVGEPSDLRSAALLARAWETDDATGLEEVESTHDPALRAELCVVRGRAAAEHERPGDAVQAFDEAIQAYASLCDKANEGRVLGYRGISLFQVGDLAASRASFDRALVLLRESGARRMEAKHLANLADILHTRGELTEALEHYREAQAASEDTAERRAEILALVGIALVTQELGRFDDTTQALERAATVAQLLGDPHYRGYVAGCRAQLLHEIGDLEGALESYKEALALGVPGLMHTAPYVAGIAAVEAALGRIDAAREGFERVRRGTLAPGLAALVGILEGHLDLARGRTAGGDAARRNAHARLDALADERIAHGDWWSLNVRFAARLLVKALGAPASVVGEPTIVVAKNAAWFRLPDRAMVDLSKRLSLRLVLQALVEAHGRSPGKPVAQPALVDAGWPGEKILPSAANVRLRVTVARLRALGLASLIRSSSEGYLLDPTARIAVDP